MDANKHTTVGALKIASVLVFIKAVLALLAGQPEYLLLNAFMGFAVTWKQVWVLLAVFILFTINVPFQIISIINPYYGVNILLQIIFCLLDVAVSLLVFINYRYYFGWATGGPDTSHDTPAEAKAT